MVVIALGANDGLRGLPVVELEKNLRTIVERVQAAGAKALLAGMLVPPNYGADYAQAFAAVFARVAQASGAAYTPFLLEGVAGKPELNQADGLHPNAAGHEILAATLSEKLLGLLADG